ncbi:Hypothetical protein, putative [Bodo saltans]|uniref:Uncharacterized protein n=1 Tax=Bodo saltans TaxID=75058 RepID=A0A0S4IR45_BODSA|nr:Hypothetical protein, putative [Bodo saltans]|eukprot:CUF29537.1 Hypothetical protein, putative [Bodo saltans]
MEDLLLIKVVVKYGASNAIANGGTQQRATQFADEDENGTYHNVSSNPDRERHNFSLAVAAERLNQPPPLRAHSSALRHRIDDVDLVDSDDLASVRLTEDSNDLTDVDEVEDLMLEINVLERACDRMVWGAANAAANGQQQPGDTDAYQQQQNIIQATRQRATTLAQCVTTICTSSQKQSHLDEEQHLEGQFLKQRQQQSGEAASRVARGSSTVEDIKNGGRTPITLGPRHPRMSAEDLKSIMDLL